ncbi:hypothetical protein SBBP2_870008 [Burkholderiales bacterium]|jgi:pyruvate kinase|nr:hypothetical protein SBBP2_870008 [Burkholderiales bacterium]
MKSRGRRATVEVRDPEVCNSLIDELWSLRASMLGYESRLEPWLRCRRAALSDLGLILKIETRRGFEHLPQMLFAAMGCTAAGVMIARGDLAVKCGFERMAEVQEEILWTCAAAHMPVVWATQVLKTLARTGLPSRAEITDAAMGERAECVMFNKGPHILDAGRTLDDMLRRMQTDQLNKRSLLRALKAWSSPKQAKFAPVRTRRSMIA